MAAVLVGLAVSSAVLLLASGRTWVQVAAVPGRLEAARSETGTALAPGLPALALVGLAGVVAVLATRGRLRMAVGVLLVLDGLGAVALAANAAPSGSDVSGWRTVALVSAALVAVCGGVVAVRGRRWPAMSSRYDAPGTPTDAPPAAPPAEGPAADRALWDAIERGEDPTT
jgi:hypothetical protein